MTRIVDVSEIPTLDQIIDCPVDQPIKIFQACQQLQVLCNKEKGIGISAVQMGLPWKLFLVKGDGTCPLVPKNEYGYFVNCSYQSVTDQRVVSLEGCLSIRSKIGQLRLFQVERYNQIRLTGSQLIIEKSKVRLETIDSEISIAEQGCVFQHEADHHSAILISDTGKEIFLH